jgi:hypothetical protein
MQSENRNVLKQEPTSSKEISGNSNNTKFSLNSFNNRLSMKFSSAATSSTSSTSTVGSQSLKLKKNTHAAFQFLRSKPPINPQTDPQTNSSKQQQQQQQIVVTDVFSDAKQVLATDEIDHNLKMNNNSLKQADAGKFTSRLSYPFISVSNENAEAQINNADNFSTEATSGQSSTKTSAKRLLFNFISGNSNNNSNDAISRNPNQHLLKLQHVQLQGSQQRRLSDYHRPLKVSDNSYFFKCHII